MNTSTGILLASASGPFGDWLATTRPGQTDILFTPRRHRTGIAHEKPICKVFKELDQLYHEYPQEIHDMWNAYARAPGISGYDAWMSQGLTANAQGWYAPDNPGEGNGAAPRPIMPGCLVPPPLVIPCNPDAKCLVGQARCDVRLDMYGLVQFRYRHSFRDPRFPNPADVTVVILGFWDEVQQKYHLDLQGEIGVNKDTGWVDTLVPVARLKMSVFAKYKYFLLEQEFNLPLNQAVAVPQLLDADAGDAEFGRAPFVDLHNGHPVPLGEFASIYGNIAWTVVRAIDRAPYRYYHIGFQVKLTARPNYQRQVGSIHIRGFYDKINFKYRLNLRGKLRTIIRKNQGPGIWKEPWGFYKIVRCDNPTWLTLTFNLTWKHDKLKLRPEYATIRKFDTAKVPCWERPA